MKRFAIGDIHGNLRALNQCLARSGFNKEEDLLIQLGDVADGYAYVYECVEELLSIKNTIFIKGNHDQWMKDWFLIDTHPCDWLQGGEGTLKSYTKNLGFGYGPRFPQWGVAEIGYKTGMAPSDLPQTHQDFWNNQKPYFKDSDNNLFVHGGFNRHFTLDEHREDIFYWDRDLFSCALSARSGKQKLKFKEEFKNIFIGHTQTTYWDKTNKPIFADIVINLDQGAGWDGKLTIMDVDTKEYWQSDLATELYPGEKGRK